MRPYSPRRRVDMGKVANEYVHRKYEPSKDSFCETRRYRGESRCTGLSDLLGIGERTL